MTDLTKLALLGTQRLPEAPSSGTPVDEFLPRLADAAPEVRLLLLAGMLSIFRRAGYMPAMMTTLPSPAPPETVPACSAGAARALGDMFMDGRIELLPEAFQRLAAKGQRVPFPLLVNCLDLREREHRDAARPVLGARGAWLAQHRETWEWAGPAATQERDVPELTRIWHEGPSDDRLASIARLRHLDAALARDLITASWKQEPADLRVALVSALGPRLSPDDEALLEAALGDRAGAVRGAAAALLARLPDSPFAARAIARADALLDLSGAQPADGGPLTVTARPPLHFNPEWEADGISGKAPRGTGERAHWLMQAVALVDPSYWSERSGRPPSALTDAAWRDEWGTAVMMAWSRAALAHGSRDWLVALWDAWLMADVSTDPNAAQIRGELLIQLFLQMPAHAAPERLATLLRQPSLAADLDLEEMLDRFPRPWPDTVAVPVLDAIDSGTTSDAGLAPWGSQLAALLRAAGPAVPATFFERALALASRDPARTTASRITHGFDLFAQQIRLRQRFHQEMLQ